MKQEYVHYEKWEDWQHGMWRKLPREEEEKSLLIAKEFTGNSERYGAAMLRVIEEWPETCRHNLSDRSQNRKAFIGHCAACLELGIPEYITRQAWGMLTEKQRVRANQKAEYAIARWEKRYMGKRPLEQIEIEFAGTL